MKTSNTETFNYYYEQHCKYLALHGFQPKTIEAYCRAIRRIGERCEGDLAELSENQLLDYFSERLATSSWSTVKLELYGLKFLYTHVLKKTWQDIPVIKPPKTTRIPDILTPAEAQQLFMATNKLSYRVFFYPVQSGPAHQRRCGANC